ncbi:protein SPA1-RELATED 3-like isoform X2 [Lotus japonicus]|uniref:protein SPA1-RELATED 3-like isoform X2 n=1 Tax=Lotus japonicus TaxID=34305 RepID=UPI002582822D|nr:protein SPA1-RELATED 3-like isoform X2 [Lotus japonicus]
MEGSSGSGFHNSDSSRALNSSGVSDRNQRPHCPEGNPFSGEAASHDSGFRKERDWLLLAQGDQHKSLGGFCEDEVEADPLICSVEWGDISLRQWLDKPERSVDLFECLHVFRQIVEIVNVAHSQGVVVNNVRPSCFVMSSFNHISFIESASCSDTGSDSLGEGVNCQGVVEVKTPTSRCPHDVHPQSFGSEDFMPAMISTTALSDSSCMLSSAVYAARASLIEETEENKMKDRRKDEEVEGKKQSFPMKQILLMEMSWYTSPEEAAGTPSSCPSDVYRLGVLLFELFCPLSSREEKSRTMSSLRHRVLPPQILLKWPKEASFCLWLLHPDPNSRPTLGELLQSEFLNEQRDDMEEREAAIELRERTEDQELLLEFLLLLQQRKQEIAEKLQHTISFLSSDIEEVTKQQTRFKEITGDDRSASSFPSMTIVDSKDSAHIGTRKRVRLGMRVKNIDECEDNIGDDEINQGSFLSKSSRLMKNFKKLEAAYFLTRCRPAYSAKPVVRHSAIANDGRGSFAATERSFINNISSKEQGRDGTSAWINPFLEGLCKYLSFSKLKVNADLKQGDLLHSSNLVCALSFDRDGEFFATAGVNKKIKVFECDTIINEDRDIHYPVVEMASRSKLSSICWNTYIKSQIASSNFEGVVQLWDVTRSQVLSEMREHERRVWSIDFSSADPTMLASGSDDGSVKLWSINQAIPFLHFVDERFETKRS